MQFVDLGVVTTFITRCHKPEDHGLNLHRREDLRSRLDRPKNAFLRREMM
jgi:hypothetical protein